MRLRWAGLLGASIKLLCLGALLLEWCVTAAAVLGSSSDELDAPEMSLAALAGYERRVRACAAAALSDPGGMSGAGTADASHAPCAVSHARAMRGKWYWAQRRLRAYPPLRTEAAPAVRTYAAGELLYADFVPRFLVPGVPVVLTGLELLAARDASSRSQVVQDIGSLCGGARGCDGAASRWADAVRLPAFVANDFITRARAPWQTVRIVAHRAASMRLDPARAHRLVSVIAGECGVEAMLCGPEEVRFLYPTLHGDIPVDVFQPDHVRYPAFAFARCAVVVLNESQGVLVPSESAVAWRARACGDGVAVVAEISFVDASNVYRVLDALQATAAEEGSTATRAADVVASLHAAWASLVMAKDPAAVRLSDALAGMPTSSGGSNQGDDGDTVRAKGPRKRLQRWQSDSAWTMLAYSLMLPAPTGVDVLDVGRSAALVAWRCPHFGAGSNHTHDDVRGYVISWRAECAAAAGGPGSGMHASSHTDVHSVTGFPLPGSNSTLLGFNVSGVVHVASNASTLLGCGDGFRDMLCATVAGLEPGHGYTFRVAARVAGRTADVVSSYSDSSLPVITLPLKRPDAPVDVTGAAVGTRVALRWAAGLDDGGRPLLGFLIARQTNLLGEYGNEVC